MRSCLEGSGVGTAGPSQEGPSQSFASSGPCVRSPSPEPLGPSAASAGLWAWINACRWLGPAADPTAALSPPEDLAGGTGCGVTARPLAWSAISWACGGVAAACGLGVFLGFLPIGSLKKQPAVDSWNPVLSEWFRCPRPPKIRRNRFATPQSPKVIPRAKQF